MLEKVQVMNPIGYFTTIGEEIEDILSSNSISVPDFKESFLKSNISLASIIKITKSEAIQIEKLTNIKDLSKYLLSFQESYKLTSKDSEVKYKENLKIYKKIQHLETLLRNEFIDGMDKLEDISNFLNIENENEIFERVRENIALYKISNFIPDDLNLYAWLKRGELDFYKQEIPEYNKELFLKWLSTKEWMNNLLNKDYIFKLPNILKEFGIGLVYTPYLNKTVHGAVRWFENRPLVQVSDKGKCLATFWYTLFHEFGHVIKHENDEIFEGNLDLPQSKINQKEKEANTFAYENLFNGDVLRKYIFSQRGNFVQDTFIDEVGKQFNVPKLFVAYWMKKALIRSKSIQQNSFHFEL